MMGHMFKSSWETTALKNPKTTLEGGLSVQTSSYKTLHTLWRGNLQQATVINNTV